MNRFNEETPSLTNHMLRIWEGPDAKYIEEPTIECDGCGRHFPTMEMKLIPDGPGRPLFCCGACAALEADEPECTCRMTGDQADARGCDLHGNLRIRPITIEVRMPNVPEVA
jgi:hypothetical protein